MITENFIFKLAIGRYIQYCIVAVGALVFVEVRADDKDVLNPSPSTLVKAFYEGLYDSNVKGEIIDPEDDIAAELERLNPSENGIIQLRRFLLENKHLFIPDKSFDNELQFLFLTKPNALERYEFQPEKKEFASMEETIFVGIIATFLSSDDPKPVLFTIVQRGGRNYIDFAAVRVDGFRKLLLEYALPKKKE